MQVDFFKKYDVHPVLNVTRLKLCGMSKLSKSDAKTVIDFARNNKPQIMQEVAEEKLKKMIQVFDRNDRSVKEYQTLSIEGSRLCGMLPQDVVSRIFTESGKK
jgi:hypothetical protein